MTTIALLLAALIVLLLAGLLLVDRWRPAPEEEPPLGRTGTVPARSSPPTGSPVAPVAPPPTVPSDLVVDAPAPPPERRPLRLRFRDASTGEVLVKLDGAYAMALVRLGAGLKTFVQGSNRDLVPDGEGWVQWTPGSRWESHPEDSSVEFRVPGYERRVLRPGEFSEATEVTLEPWSVRVRGTLGDGGSGSPTLFSYVLAEPSVDVLQTFRPRGLPSKPGPFELHDLPDGKYEFRACVQVKGVMHFARRPFEIAGGPVDLGEVSFVPAVTLRARAVDGAGAPRGDSAVSVLIEESRVPLLSGDETLEWTAMEGRRVEDSAGGGPWFLFDALPPGVRVKVLALALPGAERTITLPDSGEAEPVEIRWEGKTVKCSLRFTAGGKVPDQWLALQSPGVPATVFTYGPFTGRLGEGLLEMNLAEGPHPVYGMVLMAGSRTPRTVRGVIDVPSRAAWEATVDLEPVDVTEPR